MSTDDDAPPDVTRQANTPIFQSAGRANFKEQSLACKTGTRIQLFESFVAAAAVGLPSSKRVTSTTAALPKPSPWSKTVSFGPTGSEAQNTSGAASAVPAPRPVNEMTRRQDKQTKTGGSFTM